MITMVVVVVMVVIVGLPWQGGEKADLCCSEGHSEGRTEAKHSQRVQTHTLTTHHLVVRSFRRIG